MAVVSNPNSQTQFDNTVLSCDLPHVDGLYLAGAEELSKDSANLVLTRNGVGDWSLNRTALGAETYNVRVAINELLRKGEIPNFQQFGITPPAQPAKGIKIIDVFAIYDLGVVDATTLTLRCGKTAYADNVALVQTDIVAATAITKVQRAGTYVSTVAIAAGNQTFNQTDFSLLEIELVAVLANTGTIKIRGIGMHCHFNYN